MVAAAAAETSPARTAKPLMITVEVTARKVVNTKRERNKEDRMRWRRAHLDWMEETYKREREPTLERSLLSEK